jgi:hypothetical protein
LWTEFSRKMPGSGNPAKYRVYVLIDWVSVAHSSTAPFRP